MTTDARPVPTTAIPKETAALRAAVARVVASGNCSGCGACALLDPGLRMRLDDEGNLRPTPVDDAEEQAAAAAAAPVAPDAVKRFEDACPGVTVRAVHPATGRRHPTMGPYLRVWMAWATDTEVRYRGSSGGALTALAAWMLETGQASRMVGAKADETEPRRTVSVSILSREQAVAAAGSRYAPTASAALPEALLPGTVMVGKPCEVSAVRALTTGHSARPGDDDPVLLSFFCAGTPSQHATDRLAAELGSPAGTPVSDLWYRGRGWPGRFTVERPDGTSSDASYDESWGSALGPAAQWRCKICADGVGESADITAADFWRSDERGYPVFADGAGRSALIARTERGYDIIVRAVEAGVISVSPIEMEDLAAVQPLQTTRRSTLAGRLAGATLAGMRVPRYRGFGLLGLALPRFREVVRVARGTFRRARARRAALAGRRS
ncbi:Coenzyme F420 hydrogenase/dehydrogenase, beta subunit C-terminal domain [Leifsonia virtsii]|uniref:Coenzyme F420 hydrogenase/dehydrogenase, beta subunit C-terminal domain n=1 Tax=Leifsonia virtsii TaxID=3035915 RepID=A0ABT8IWA3_9MICO|nr:Coenzyme F420 hydrogenase/dehydrogenase, beta subunit C-terminal domain [Leifsonia virtsii]MDN4597099.1 Coenzyme F420 hydrogenase/dehydrogenase, beta subunit C-terminal domain [Leifsonia virtsii]